MPQELKKLKIFVQASQSVVQCEEKIHELDVELKKIIAALEELRSMFAKTESDFVEASKRVRILEKERFSLEDQEIALQRKIATVFPSPKEQLGMRKKVLVLAEARSHNAEALAHAFEVFNIVRIRLSDYKKSVKAQVNKCEQRRLHIEKESVEAKNYLCEAKKFLEETKKGISINLLSRVIPIASKLSNPLVELSSQGTCRVCFFAVAARDISEMRKGAIVSCQGCYRLLYFLTDSKSFDDQEKNVSTEES